MPFSQAQSRFLLHFLMLNALNDPLCSKLCWHNRQVSIVVYESCNTTIFIHRINQNNNSVLRRVWTILKVIKHLTSTHIENINWQQEWFLWYNFRNDHVSTKIMKILYYDNLEPYSSHCQIQRCIN